MFAQLGQNHPFLGIDDQTALALEIPNDAEPSLSGGLYPTYTADDGSR